MEPAAPLYRPFAFGQREAGGRIREAAGNLFLAPVAGYTDRAFRSLCVRHGATLAFTEMISCEGLVRDNRRSLDLARKADGEVFSCVQLFGSDPDVAGHAAEGLASKLGPDLIDLNCGCPVPKIVKAGAGSALMKDPERIGRIVKKLREASGLPVSVKIRSGWDGTNLNYLECALAAQDAGAAFVTLHPRTRVQMYSGNADWSHIRRLKGILAIPVAASGDLFSPEAALRVFRETGCDAVMFARGALGNPFIFSDTRELLEGRPVPERNPDDAIRTALEHLEAEAALLGEGIACRELRKHLCHYIKKRPDAARIRNALVHADNLETCRSILLGTLGA